MANRFYVPTPTRYTSQFVEERYPFDAMLALEQQKVQRAENISAGAGEIESLLGPLTTPGIYTQGIADQTQAELSGKVNKFYETHQDDMTSLNAIRDLSKLRGTVLNDPRVKAMELDREQWTPQYNQVRLNKRSNLDIDPNLVDQGKPELGVRQWNVGEQYPIVQPLTPYQDYTSSMIDAFNQIPIQSNNENANPVFKTVTDNLGNKIQMIGYPEIGIRDKEQLGATEIASAESLISGKTPGSDWWKTNFINTNGREPTLEDAMVEVKRISPSFYARDEKINWDIYTPPKIVYDEAEGEKSKFNILNIPGSRPLGATTIQQVAPSEEIGKGFKTGKAGVRPKTFIEKFPGTPSRDIGLTFLKTSVAGGLPFKVYAGARRLLGEDKIDPWVKNRNGFLGTLLKAYQGYDDALRFNVINNDAKKVIHELKNTTNYYDDFVKEHGDFEVIEKDGKFDIDKNKKYIVDLAKYSSDILEGIGEQITHPRVEDFTKLQEGNTVLNHNEIATYFDHKYGFDVDMSRESKGNRIESMSASLGMSSDQKTFMKLGEPAENTYSIQDIIDDGFVAFKTKGILKNDETNYIHPNAIVIGASDARGKKTATFYMPETDEYAFPKGSFEVEQNYTDLMLRRIARLPILDEVFPSNYEVWENMRAQPEIEKDANNSGKNISEAQETWLSNNKYSYVRFGYNPKNKKYYAKVSTHTPVVVPSGDIKERVEKIDESINASSRDELNEMFTNRLGEAMKSIMKIDKDKGINNLSEDDIKNLNAYELYLIQEINLNQ